MLNRFHVGGLVLASLLGGWWAPEARGERAAARAASARPDAAEGFEGCEAASGWPGSDGPDYDARAHDVREFCPGNFGRHRLNDLPGFAVLGQQAAFMAGYDFSPDASVLYALNDDTKQLGISDPATGAFVAIGTSTPVPGHLWTGLAVDPMLGTIYATSSDEDTTSTLYTLDPATGAATFVGSTTVARLLVAIAMNCDGELYAHDVIEDAIYQLDPVTGTPTLVGPTGLDSNFAQGMDFDNPTGTLYAWTYQGGGLNQYGTIDLETGALTPLSTDDPEAEFEGAALTYCAPFAQIFSDGFESGDTSAWSQAVEN